MDICRQNPTTLRLFSHGDFPVFESICRKGSAKKKFIKYLSISDLGLNFRFLPGHFVVRNFTFPKPLSFGHKIIFPIEFHGRFLGM